jgi:taurine dehydrogenase small subunit
MVTVADEVTVDTLQAFADGFNAHDVDTLMTFMTEDCVFEISYGPDVCGKRFEGQDAVRAAFASVWEKFRDAQWRRPTHFVAGNRGVSEWTFTGTDKDGGSVEVNGCDIFTFRAGKIQIKDSYRKIRAA